MSDNKPGTNLSAEELEKVGGGGCTIAELVGIADDLKEAYESLIEFTTYMMERVTGK